MIKTKFKTVDAKSFFLILLSLLCINNAWSACNKIDSAFWDYPLRVNFGASLYIDPATPVGTILAQQSVSSAELFAANNGWLAICDNANDEVKYWWLEQHYAQSSGGYPVNGVTAPTQDGHIYVIRDNGRNNPYGGSGSGSVGYTVELLSDGNSYPFSWLRTAPNKNLPPISPSPIRGIRCADAQSGASGYPPFTGQCRDNQYIVNWRQLGSFTLKVSLYRLAGTIPASGLMMTNNNDGALVLFSLMDNSSTPPSWNTRLFNLVRLGLANDVKIQTAPCQAFNTVTVNLGRVNSSDFRALGQPADGVADKLVNVTARCSQNTAMRWAVMGTTSNYNPDGTQGILALDNVANSAEGVGVQLTDTSGNPLPITPATGVDYRWIDTNLVSDASGILSMEFLARYVQVGTIKPGMADSHAHLVIAPK